MASTPDILVRFGGSVDQSFENSVKRVRGAADDARDGFSGLSGALSSVRAAPAIVGIGATFAYLTKTAISLQQLDLSLQAVFGSSSAAASEMEYLRGVSERLGVDVMSLAESYVSFAAAAQGTTFEGAQTKRIFEAITGAMSKLGMPSERVKDALNAVQQMMSKGKVQAEELRGQLGENLPGAFNLAAKAMGVTTAQLDKMLESGQVTAEKLLPNLAIELEKLYKTNDRMTGVVSEWNRFKSSGQDTAEAFGKMVLPAISSTLEALTKLVNKARELPQWMGESVARAQGFVTAEDRVNSLTKEIEGLKGLIDSLDDGERMASPSDLWRYLSRKSEIEKQIADLEKRRTDLSGKLGVADPGAPKEEKKEEPKAKTATGAGPSDDFKKLQDKVAEDRRKEDDKKMSEAARVAQYELEISRQVAAEKAAIMDGSQAKADAAQKAQEDALKRLVEAGASRERVDLWSAQVGAQAAEAPQMEIKAKVAMAVDTAAMAAIPEEIRKAIATTGTLGPLPLEIIPILVDDTPAGSNPVANAADAAGSRAE